MTERAARRTAFELEGSSLANTAGATGDGPAAPEASEAPEAQTVPEPPVTPDNPQAGAAAPADAHAPPTTTAPEAATQSRGAALRARWAAFGDRIPLSARLVILITVLIGAGLVLAGVTSAALLQRSLVAQIDDKLRTEGYQIAQAQASNWWSQTPVGPSDYYVRLQVGENEIPWLTNSARTTYGTPQVPDMTADQANARNNVPFTVPSDRAGSRWRVIAFATTTYGGSVVVALPLSGARETTETMAAVLLLSGLGILLLGGLAAGWAVRRSLKPLAQIEDTAAAIAAGDLSRRVPTLPESTEVGRLAASLNGMLAQIEQAFGVRTASETRMRRFVADASHELRTPLATIRGYAELYRMGATSEPEQVADTMRRIEGSATRMGTLVEDLLLLARLDEGRPVAQEPVDLTVLAADAVSDLHALDPDRPARLVPLAPTGLGGPVLVTGDDARLRQVVANLVGNVVRHTPAGTPVEIAVGATDGVGVLEVRDHGPGIDPQHAARVFERFYRVDASRTRESGGAGLGMAIVAAIVAAHRGHVSLAETPGGGTTVRVVVPSGPSSN